MRVRSRREGRAVDVGDHLLEKSNSITDWNAFLLPPSIHPRVELCSETALRVNHIMGIGLYHDGVILTKELKNPLKFHDCATAPGKPQLHNPHLLRAE